AKFKSAIKSVPLLNYNELSIGHCCLDMVISKDLLLTWGDRFIGIPMKRSFPLYLFGKVTVYCIKYGTLMLSTDSEEFRVIMDKSIGYINATKMCYVGGKDFKDWSRLKGSYE